LNQDLNQRDVQIGKLKSELQDAKNSYDLLQKKFENKAKDFKKYD